MRPSFQPWREILLVFAVAKVFQGVFVYAGHLLRDPLPPETWPGVENWWLNPWTAYDSQWYLEIAARGYRELTAPFFPLYPLLLKICGHTAITRALAGVIISNLAFLLALYFLRRLTQEDFDTATARAVIWVAAFYPTAAVFGAVYTEALFLLFLVLAFTAARREKWAAAGFWGLLAGATRNSGPVVFAALALDYLHARRYRLKEVNLKPLLFLSLTLAGPLLFGLYLLLSVRRPSSTPQEPASLLPPGFCLALAAPLRRPQRLLHGPEPQRRNSLQPPLS
ncbi:mannosyltransferase family protein [Thermodesulfitimonas sp.]